MIEVRNIQKSFGQVRALGGISFTARDGQITGLLGPKGAGKTTALRILYTVLAQDAGTATVDGYDTRRHENEVRECIGVVAEGRGLYPRLTSRENVRYFGKLHGLGGRNLERSIDELIQQLEMEDIADRRAEGFSSGQEVKVAIARAVIHRPKNVLLDEVTSGVDASSEAAMRSFIRGLRDQGTCLLFCSHIMPDISALCDNIVVLAQGQVVARGTRRSCARLWEDRRWKTPFEMALGSNEGLE